MPPPNGMNSSINTTHLHASNAKHRRALHPLLFVLAALRGRRPQIIRVLVRPPLLHVNMSHRKDAIEVCMRLSTNTTRVYTQNAHRHLECLHTTQARERVSPRGRSTRTPPLTTVCHLRHHPAFPLGLPSKSESHRLRLDLEQSLRGRLK